jgi:hypothetical protein
MPSDTFEVKAKEPERYICWVGYDKGVKSYFVYVAERGLWNKGKMQRNNHVVIWRGMEEGDEIRTVAGVKELLKPYAELPDWMESSLARAGGAGEAEERGLEAVNG